MLMYIPTGAKLEIMNQISDQFDIFSKDPLLKESLRKNFKRSHDAKVMLNESDEGHFERSSSNILQLVNP